MTQNDLGKAKDRDLVASVAAMRRAGKMARELAMRTETAIIVVKDSRMVRVTAEELREENIHG